MSSRRLLTLNKLIIIYSESQEMKKKWILNLNIWNIIEHYNKKSATRETSQIHRFHSYQEGQKSPCSFPWDILDPNFKMAKNNIMCFQMLQFLPT